jgi:CheY-like chemotaxis protein
MGPKPRILVVDDEEAILETMTYTFQSDYEVLTSADARRALRLLDEKAPVAAVLTDQRMPGMSGVEFVTEVCRRHPRTVRMILTGFSDMQAIVQAINDGHVWAYVAKPWEPDQLKQLMKQAVEHHQLSVENERLLVDLRRANLFLESVMDELDTGALALDADGVIQAANRPVREYLSLAGELRGRRVDDVLDERELARLRETVSRVGEDAGASYDEVELGSGAAALRLRIATRVLLDEGGSAFGRVLLVREVSHEPLVRRFDEILREISQADGGLRGVLERSRELLRRLADEVHASRVGSSAMSELGERLSRTLTAVENWLDVDEALAREAFPDAQLLQDRMRISLARWPLPGEVPGRVRELARRVEDYYESGENPKQHVL